MSQNIHITPDETTIWSTGGNIYHSLKQAIRNRRTYEYGYTDGVWGKLDEPNITPIYEVKLEWTLVEED